MDIKTLEALGVSPEELGDRIVDQAVNALLSSTGFNPDSEEETRYESRFKKEIESRVQKAVTEKIAALAEVHLVPKVGEMIENANLRQTNNYGEAKGEPMTFIEYIAMRAGAYMSENVDYNGQSKEESSSSHNWRSCGPRMTVMMKMYIRETMESHAKKAVTDVNAVFAQAIQKSAVDAITAATAAIKVSISA